MGNSSVSGAKFKYFRPKFSAWDTIAANKATFEAGNDTNWNAGDVIQTNSKFYKATTRWIMQIPQRQVLNKLFSLRTDNATHVNGYGKLWVENSYVRDITHSDRDFYKATSAWNSVGSHTGAATVDSWVKDKVVLNDSNKKFYKAKANFTSIQAHNVGTLYQAFDANTVGNSNREYTSYAC